MKKLIISSAVLFLLHGFSTAQKTSSTTPSKQNVTKPATKKTVTNKPEAAKKQQPVTLQQDVKLPMPDAAVLVNDSTAMPPAKKTE